MITMTAAIVASMGLNSCTGDTIYSEHHDINRLGWDKDSVETFVVAIAERSTPCDVLIHIRHVENYPYQNLWLFVDTETPSRTYTDTLEVYLADDRGIWLGNSKNGMIEMPVLLEQNHYLPADTIVYRIHQGMREDCLRGVVNVGMTVEVCK